MFGIPVLNNCSNSNLSLFRLLQKARLNIMNFLLSLVYSLTLKGVSCHFRPYRSTDLLVPSADTLLQMWSEMDTQCNLCCDASFCNFERLPPGNTLHTGTASKMAHNMFIILTSTIICLIIKKEL